MMDARQRFKRLLAIDSFAEFTQQVCKAAADFTRCSIAIWDGDGVQRTDRWMYHKVCKSFYNNPEIRATRCDQDDASAVDYVLRTGFKANYTCWAGFTCEMIPIKAWDQPVGLISIGEFFTRDCDQLRPAASQVPGADLFTIVDETKAGRIPVLDDEQRDGVLTAVEHIAGILSDLVMAKINSHTLPDYLAAVASQMAGMWTESTTDGRQLAAALEGFTLVSLANLFFKDVHKFLQQHRDRALHEALTPLSSIFIAAAALPEDCKQRHRIETAAYKIEKDARALLAETDVLEGSWWKLTPERLSPNDLAAEMYSEFQSHKEIADRLIVRGDRGGVSIDVSLARFVVRELVANAFKATQPGRRRIEASLNIVEGDLVTEVVDNGCGIPETELGRIFEPGIRLGQAGYGSGSGHGLYKLRENVLFVGGKVEVSAADGGTRFKVILPGFTET